MTDVKRLLEQATPLPWMADAPPVTLDPVEDRWGIFAAARERNTCIALLGTDKQDRNDAALIVHAVNTLPAYEALREAGEHLVEFGPNPTVWRELHAALRRLREGVPA